MVLTFVKINIQSTSFNVLNAILSALFNTGPLHLPQWLFFIIQQTTSFKFQKFQTHQTLYSDYQRTPTPIFLSCFLYLARTGWPGWPGIRSTLFPTHNNIKKLLISVPAMIISLSATRDDNCTQLNKKTILNIIACKFIAFPKLKHWQFKHLKPTKRSII